MRVGPGEVPLALRRDRAKPWIAHPESGALFIG